MTSMMQTRDVAHRKRVEHLAEALDASRKDVSEIIDITEGYFEILEKFHKAVLDAPYRFLKEEWRKEAMIKIKTELSIGMYSISNVVFDEATVPSESRATDAYYIGFGISDKAIKYIPFIPDGILPKGSVKYYGEDFEIEGPRMRILLYIEKLDFTNINADFSKLGLEENKWYAIGYEDRGYDDMSILEVMGRMGRHQFLVKNPLNIYDENKDIARYLIEQIIQEDQFNRIEGRFMKLSVVKGVFRWIEMIDHNEHLDELEYYEVSDVF